MYIGTMLRFHSMFFIPRVFRKLWLEFLLEGLLRAYLRQSNRLSHKLRKKPGLPYFTVKCSVLPVIYQDVFHCLVLIRNKPPTPQI